MSSMQILKESLVVWIVVIGALRILESLQAGAILSGQITSLVSALILLYVPLGFYIKRRERVDFLDWSLKDFGSSVALFLIFSLILLPAVIAVNHYLQGWLMGTHFQSGGFTDLGSTTLGQLVMVALPEEFFFRGYLQGRFNRIFTGRLMLFGVPVGLGLIIVSLIFALSHSLIHFAVWHSLIFFPSLAFGWLREKRGTITASIFFHTVCNLFSRWVAFNYN